MAPQVACGMGAVGSRSAEDGDIVVVPAEKTQTRFLELHFAPLALNTTTMTERPATVHVCKRETKRARVIIFCSSECRRLVKPAAV
jgi:hypothetical protein